MYIYIYIHIYIPIIWTSLGSSTGSARVLYVSACAFMCEWVHVWVRPHQDHPLGRQDHRAKRAPQQSASMWRASCHACPVHVWEYACEEFGCKWERVHARERVVVSECVFVCVTERVCVSVSMVVWVRVYVCVCELTWNVHERIWTEREQMRKLELCMSRKCVRFAGQMRFWVKYRFTQRTRRYYRNGGISTSSKQQLDGHKTSILVSSFVLLSSTVQRRGAAEGVFSIHLHWILSSAPPTLSSLLHRPQEGEEILHPLLPNLRLSIYPLFSLVLTM